MAVGLLLLRALPCRADCIPFAEATKHVGETRCVSGKVLRVKQGDRGVTFFDFCADYRLCSFTVVVFPGDLKNIGDVRTLQGKDVEIHGPIKLYDNRAEIILRDYKQLSGEAARIPPLPKGYDVEKKGRYSAGKFSYPNKRKPTKKRQTAPAQTEEQEDASVLPD
jgi:ssDNA-binding Zn-finger/Zn-ribbon topoisomerase 1